MVADLYQQHAAICESKAAAQMMRKRRPKRKAKLPMG